MPRTSDTVILADMADRLNAQFAKHLDEPIKETTPYDWWKRTKQEDISEPLPKPIDMIGRTPVFRWTDIMRWFIRYKGVGTLKVKKTKEEVG